MLVGLFSGHTCP